MHYETEYISDLTELIKYLMELRENDFWSFRGQRSDSWSLGVGHKLLKGGNYEENLYHFRKRCMAFRLPDMPPMEYHWDWLFYGQHFGLRTRLLDWTSNPLVAIYFAVENILCKVVNDSTKKKLHYPTVWALKVDGKTHFRSPDVLGDPRHITEWLMINPPPVTDRLAAQSGKFSYHPSDDHVSLDQCPRRPSERLVKVIIKHSQDSKEDPDITCENIRKFLGIMNIHHASLFSDPQGVAEFINHEWPYIAKEDYLDGPDKIMREIKTCENEIEELNNKINALNARLKVRSSRETL